MFDNKQIDIHWRHASVEQHQQIAGVGPDCRQRVVVHTVGDDKSLGRTGIIAGRISGRRALRRIFGHEPHTAQNPRCRKRGMFMQMAGSKRVLQR